MSKSSYILSFALVWCLFSLFALHRAWNPVAYKTGSLTCKNPVQELSFSSDEDAVQCVFVISNENPFPLEIRAISTSCACAVVEHPPSFVSAGGGVEVPGRLQVNAGTPDATTRPDYLHFVIPERPKEPRNLPLRVSLVRKEIIE